ncbi:MAG: hypothetical protein INR69_08210 [Mucilaginibacter polytrichastri]|nr:hypothetical protein [Mucilaginibacter polytrichastri]
MQKISRTALLLLISCCLFFPVSCVNKPSAPKKRTVRQMHKLVIKQADSIAKKDLPTLDTAQYDSLLGYLANGDSLHWPVKNQPYPLPGAILPFKRIVAFYGNTLSKKMGILGELPKPEMAAKLDSEATKWALADPKLPVQKAMHLIVIVAQANPGADSLYKLRHPDRVIDSLILLARKHNSIVFLDLQVGLSTLEKELPSFETYLKMPDVHLGIDAEFSMKTGDRPGTRVGTFDAADINYASGYLAKLVQDENVPPKVLIVHRYTQKMITNSKSITLRPEVQVVMDMDGWGGIDVKRGTYKRWIYPEPVQFTGFKLFYKNDKRKPGTRMMTREEVLQLKPAPSYIQYQ